MSNIRKVAVKRTIYTRIKRASVLKKYIIDCMANGMSWALFMDPHILAAFYASGLIAQTALNDAINAYTLSPTKGKMEIVKAKMALVVIWLNGYADQVEVISNADANRTTREEAGANISNSFLTHQVIVAEKKGNPDMPVITAMNTGDGNVEVEITNGKEYQPNSIVIIAVEIPAIADPYVAPAMVELVKDQLSINCKAGVHTVMMSISGKGRLIGFSKLKTGVSYNFYAYAQNGKLQLSALTPPVVVKM